MTMRPKNGPEWPRTMTETEYEMAIEAVSVFPSFREGGAAELQYLVNGLVSEAGEVAGKLAKAHRDMNWPADPHTYITIEELASELGDVLFYLTHLVDWCGLTMGELRAKNAAKLRDRQLRGKLGGSGDNR